MHHPSAALNERVRARHTKLLAQEATKPIAQREREARQAMRRAEITRIRMNEWIVAGARKDGIALDPITLQAPIRARQTHARRRGAGRPRAQASRSSARSGDSGEDDPAPPTRRCCARSGARR